MLQAQQILQERYQLQTCLGHNAGRETWLAIDCQTQAPVVTKLLTFSDRVHWEQLRLFEREAQVLKQLTHPQIPRYHDFFCLDDRLFWFALVQSHIPGRSLKQMLEQGHVFSESEVRRIAKQLLQILIYLHELSPPVLHRDIKPSNLILAEDHNIYLVDFGTVQDRAAKEGATFTVVGTYGYAPLEQLGGRATPASDLYALGATLIHLLTGVAPADLPQADGRLQFTAGLTLNPGLVRWLWRLTEINATSRFATARAALQSLLTNEAAIANMAAELNDLVQHPSAPAILQPQSRNVSHPAIAPEPVAVNPRTENGKRRSKRGEKACDLHLQKSPQRLELAINTKRFNLRTFATEARFDSQQFEICWRWFGLSRRQQGLITDIDHVSKGELQGAQKVFPAVKLTVGVHEYLITSVKPPLTEADRDWLLQAIQQWLGLE